MKQLTLSELNQSIKQVLNRGLEKSYWVVGEISDLNVNQRGHCYLELVEKSDEQIVAKQRATIWSSTYRNLSVWFEKMTESPLKSGMKILCNVSVQYHEVFGMSLNIHDIDAQYTIGEKAVKRQKTLSQLEEDGVLYMNKELVLPLALQQIAVISSPTAAGYGDFINQLSNNSYQYAIECDLYEAVMQGNTSSQSIANALLAIHNKEEKYDLVCIIRGGGSQADLDSYDSYELGAFIAQFPLPILTGIGHDRDESVADIVAHTPLKTPTAVAEYIIDHNFSYESALISLLNKVKQLSLSQLHDSHNELNQIKYQFTIAANTHLSNKKHQLANAATLLKSATRSLLREQATIVTDYQHTIEILSPDNVLKRGYTITTHHGRAISKDTKIQKGDTLTTLTSHDIITSTVEKKKPKL